MISEMVVTVKEDSTVIPTITEILNSYDVAGWTEAYDLNYNEWCFGVSGTKDQIKEVHKKIRRLSRGKVKFEFKHITFEA